MAHEKIVTAFNTRHDAEAAKSRLENAGIADRDINLIMGDDLKEEGEEIRHPSIWRRLFGETVDESDVDTYMHAIQIGGVVLTVRAKEDEINTVMNVLGGVDHSYTNTLDRDITEREIGRSTDVDLLVNDNVVAPGTAETTLTQATLTEPTYRGMDRAASVEEVEQAPVLDDVTDVETIPLAEEQLEVGKRVVNDGTMRVRRYVTEKDAEADVTLRDEHAEIFRRSIHDDQPLHDVDWSDKVVEIEETREEPVINKVAREVEEVEVRKGVTDHVEKVNDTVRRQDVEIERVNRNGEPMTDKIIESIDRDKK